MQINCLAVSAQFAQWLRDKKFGAGLFHLSGMPNHVAGGASGRWSFTDRSSFGHRTVLVGEWTDDTEHRFYRQIV